MGEYSAGIIYTRTAIIVVCRIYQCNFCCRDAQWSV